MGVATPDADLAFAMRLADEAGSMALVYFDRGIGSELKPDGTAVTEADRAVERFLREQLTSHRPGDALLGEEYGAGGSGDRTWIIDPIDGTVAFANGDPDWRVHLALEVRGIVTVAVVVAPASGRRWFAAEGRGAFESPWPPDGQAPQRLAVSATSRLADGHIEAWPLEGEVSRVGRIASLPTAVVPVAVARGNLDAFVIDCCHAWDHAPWILIVEEAGGRFSDWTGGRSAHHRGGVFSNSALHDPLLKCLSLPRSVS